MIIKYVDRILIDRFTCKDTQKTIDTTGAKCWKSGGLYYIQSGYNVKTIDSDLIISIDGQPGPYGLRHKTI